MVEVVVVDAVDIFWIVGYIIGEKHILVPTFSGDSHFSPYILFLPQLVPILKNASRFGPCRYSFNKNILRSKLSNSKSWHVY